MPKQTGNFIPMETLSVPDRMSHQARFQEKWYQIAASLFQGMSVLDVGAANGYGMDIMKAAGVKSVSGIDLLPLREDVAPTRIQDIATEQYDAITACDVIEHVPDAREFLSHLVRVSRKGAFFTTPNWNYFGPRLPRMNPFHVQEFTPIELKKLLTGYHYQVWTADANWVVTYQPTLHNHEQDCNFGVLVTK